VASRTSPGGDPGLHATSKVLGHDGGWLGVAIGGGLSKGLGVAGAVVVLLAILVIATVVTHGRRAPSPPRGVGTFLRRSRSSADEMVDE